MDAIRDDCQQSALIVWSNYQILVAALTIKEAHVIYIGHEGGFVHQIVLALVPDICPSHEILVASLCADCKDFLSIGVLFSLINRMLMEKVTLIVD